MIGLGGPSRWQRPPAGAFKLNMACHAISKSCRYGLGVLIRDSEGAIMAVLEDYLLSNNELLQLHARAVLVAIKFAYDVGLRCLVVELDNQELYSLIQAGSPCFDPIGVIVDDICLWIPLFSSLCFVFSKKSCNKAANALATEATSSLITQVWLDDHPTALLHLFKMIFFNKIAIVSIKKKKASVFYYKAWVLQKWSRTHTGYFLSTRILGKLLLAYPRHT